MKRMIFCFIVGFVLGVKSDEAVPAAQADPSVPNVVQHER